MEKKEYETNFLLEDAYWWFLGRQKIVSTFLRSVDKELNPPRILDAGCGTGKLLTFWNTLAPAVGLELHEEGISFCQKRQVPRLVQGSVSRLPFCNGSFGLISCFDVLYHQDVDEIETLREFYRICAPGGWLFINDAAFPFLRSEHDESVHGARRFTRQNLRRSVEECGFSVCRISYWNFFLFPFVALFRLTKNRFRQKASAPTSDLKALPAIINSLLLLIITFEALLMRMMALPFGTSIMLLAQKPKVHT